MKPPWRESAGIVPWLGIIVIILLFGVLVIEGVIPQKQIVSNQPLIESISTIITMSFLIIGGFLSYLRFFKGRLFKPKLTIDFETGVTLMNNEMFHWIDVKMENKGSVPIWNYKLETFATFHSEHPYCKKITDFISVRDGVSSYEEILIDVGETGYEHISLLVPLDVGAVTYHFVVTDQNKTRWSRSITLPNKPPNSES